ncbi:hypothetical protein Psfp_01509 [Pelotomaculum sp. FP]|nr:hypothetical protein Psfp_01509 [Pelotomaculum sp. FP]
MNHILLVEDDLSLIDGLEFSLHRHIRHRAAEKDQVQGYFRKHRSIAIKSTQNYS